MNTALASQMLKYGSFMDDIQTSYQSKAPVQYSTLLSCYWLVHTSWNLSGGSARPHKAFPVEE